MNSNSSARWGCFLVAAFASFEMPAAAMASVGSEVIFSVDKGVQRIGGASGLQGVDHIPLDIRVTTAAPYVTLAQIFNGLSVTPADVGKTFTADIDSDSGFDVYTQVLTDDVEHWTSLPNLGGMSFASECVQFQGGSSCGSNIGLEGFVIDRVSYSITDWYFDSPGRDPNHNGFWTDTYLGFRFTIEGRAIPEPSSLALFAIGCAAIGCRRRR